MKLRDLRNEVRSYTDPRSSLALPRWDTEVVAEDEAGNRYTLIHTIDQDHDVLVIKIDGIVGEKESYIDHELTGPLYSPEELDQQMDQADADAEADKQSRKHIRRQRRHALMTMIGGVSFFLGILVAGGALVASVYAPARHAEDRIVRTVIHDPGKTQVRNMWRVETVKTPAITTRPIWR
jgi:hypothetical protein